MNTQPLLDRPSPLATREEQMGDTSDLVFRALDRSFSAAGSDATLRRPLADLVTATLTAAGRSSAIQLSYQTAIGLFVQYLDRERGDWLPQDLALHLRPFAELSN
jgi:hypothetical protein